MKHLYFFLIFLAVSPALKAQSVQIGDTIYVNEDTFLRAEATFSSRNNYVSDISESTLAVLKAISTDGNYYKIDDGNYVGWLHYTYVSDLRIVRQEKQKVLDYEEKLLMFNEENLKPLREKGYGILLKKMSYSTNSAKGVTPSVTFENIERTKIIKYITFTFTPYNPVGDIAFGNIRNLSTSEARGVGPIRPGEEASFSFENLWYNDTIKCIVINKIRVEHMDGSIYTYIKDLADIRKDSKSIKLNNECDVVFD